MSVRGAAPGDQGPVGPLGAVVVVTDPGGHPVKLATVMLMVDAGVTVIPPAGS